MKRLATRAEMLHRVSMPYDTNVWYHVTSELSLQSIRDHGLTPTERGVANKNFPNHSVAENGVYLVPTIAMAQAWTSPEQSIAQSEGYPGGSPTILKIVNLDLRRIIPDPEELNIIIDNTMGHLRSEDDWESAYNALRDADFPEFFIDWGIRGNRAVGAPKNAESFFYWVERDPSGSVLFDELMKMSEQQRNELVEFWKETQPTSAFVYLGVIPAQNISVASYYPSSEEPPTDVGITAYDDWQNEFANYPSGHPRYKYQPMFSKKAMAMRPEDLQAWIEENGPYAYHDTDADSIEGIIKNGIVPWNELPDASQIEQKYIEGGIGHLIPRPGFVYMHTHKPGSPAFYGSGARVLIDLRKLDPSRFSADEDYVEAEYLKNPHNEMFEEIRSYPTNHPEWWADTGPETLGDWAEDNAHIVDDPDVAHQSLRSNKTLAYWGTIPMSAIADIGIA